MWPKHNLTIFVKLKDLEMTKLVRLNLWEVDDDDFTIK